MGEHRSEIEPLIFEGFNELIRRFNRLLESDAGKLAPLMGRTRELKQILDNNFLPSLEEIGAREILLGVKEAKKLMDDGQKISKRVIADTAENRGQAILAPNLQTSEKALAVGVAGHLIERATFWYFERRGLTRHQWEKDDILYSLEEMALLMEAEFRVGKGPEPKLLEIFSSPTSLDENGAWVDENQNKWKSLSKNIKSFFPIRSAFQKG